MGNCLAHLRDCDYANNIDNIPTTMTSTSGIRQLRPDQHRVHLSFVLNFPEGAHQHNYRFLTCSWARPPANDRVISQFPSARVLTF